MISCDAARQSLRSVDGDGLTFECQETGKTHEGLNDRVLDVAGLRFRRSLTLPEHCSNLAMIVRLQRSISQTVSPPQLNPRSCRSAFHGLDHLTLVAGGKRW